MAIITYLVTGLMERTTSKELSVRAELLEKGGPEFWSAFMDELRHIHLGARRPARSVFNELQLAYEKAIVRPGRSPEGD
jgi:hypothetical protein